MIPGRLTVGAPLDVPIDIDADPARELARRELSRAVYAAEEPSLPERVVDWIGDRIDDLLRAASGAGLGGGWGVLVLVVALVAVVVLVRWRLGRVARGEARAAVLDAVVRTAAEHRRLAAAAEAGGDLDEAVRETMRALVRSLEERAVLDPRPGRTAGEVARDVRDALPPAAEPVADAARVFDETVYGRRRADAAALEGMRSADAAVLATRVVPAA